MELKELEIWAVQWEDAHCNLGEFEMKEDVIHKPIVYITVGVKLRDDEMGFTVCADVSETLSFRGTNFIPAKMIVKKWKIGPVSPRKLRQRKLIKNTSQTSVDMPMSSEG